MALESTTASIGFAAANAVATLGVAQLSGRKTLLFTGTANSFLSLAGLWWSDVDPAFADATCAVAAANATLQYSLNALKMKQLGSQPLVKMLVYYSVAGTVGAFLAERCVALYNHRYDI